VYISRDVIFDETQFLFSKLYPNADARLCVKYLCFLIPFWIRSGVLILLIQLMILLLTFTMRCQIWFLWRVHQHQGLLHFLVENWHYFMPSRSSSAPAASADPEEDLRATSTRASALVQALGGAVPSASANPSPAAPSSTPGATPTAQSSLPLHSPTFRAPTSAPSTPTASAPLHGGTCVSASNPEPGSGSSAG
jgi:hypothetical protein